MLSTGRGVRSWRRSVTLGALTLGTVGIGSAFVAANSLPGHVSAQTTDQSLTAPLVLSAFKTHGLPADHLQYLQPRTGGPSGPPTPEREAVSFSVPDIAPAGGILYVFDGSAKLAKKSAWFAKAGAAARTVTYQNVLLYLDKQMPGSEAKQYRQALKGIK